MCTGRWNVHVSIVPTAAWSWHQSLWSWSCRAQPLNYLHPLFYDPYGYSQMALSLCLSYLNPPFKKEIQEPVLLPSTQLIGWWGCAEDGRAHLVTAASRPTNKRSQSNLFFHLSELDNIIILLWWLSINCQLDLTQNHLRRESQWGIICLGLACVHVC